MTKNEIAHLVKLLKKLQSEHLSPPNTPEEIWLEIMKLFPLPAVEVIIIKKNPTKFLLTERYDKYWNGWHIPGGFMIPKETIANACLRVSKRELGIACKLEKIVTAFAWNDHPYGSPISLICICSTKQEPLKGKFFTKMPKNMIQHHADFIKMALKTISK